MEENNRNNQLKFVKALNRESALEILVRLCEEEDLAERIVAMAKASLTGFNAGTVADEVFGSLNSIQVEDLWDNDGQMRWCHQAPTDYEMLTSTLAGYLQQMEQLRNLGMIKEEKEYCKGILYGLLQYAEDGDNEFHEAVPDDPYTLAEDIVYEWKKCHTAEDIKEIQAVYDSLFANGGDV
ncbi:MAG: hypothetical protein FWC60_09690 [Firmicutes bacterium]|nr:hypothetical protein [Bacillota bacterium]